MNFLTCLMCNVAPTPSDDKEDDPRQTRLPPASSSDGFHYGAVNEDLADCEDEDADGLPPVIWLSISDGDRDTHLWKQQDKIAESMKRKTKNSEPESRNTGVIGRLLSRNRERSQSPFRNIRRALSKSRSISRSRNLSRSKRTTKSRSSIPSYIETKPQQSIEESRGSEYYRRSSRDRGRQYKEVNNRGRNSKQQQSRYVSTRQRSVSRGRSERRDPVESSMYRGNSRSKRTSSVSRDIRQYSGRSRSTSRSRRY